MWLTAVEVSVDSGVVVGISSVGVIDGSGVELGIPLVLVGGITVQETSASTGIEEKQRTIIPKMMEMIINPRGLHPTVVV